MKKIKTIPEQIEAVRQMAAFSFFYAARWLKNDKAPALAMSEALSLHTPLLFHGLGYSKKELWQEIPLCREILASADEFAALVPEEFEKIMLQRHGEAIAARAEEIYPESRGIRQPPSWNCGSLKYDPPTAEAPRKCMIHMYNMASPHSLFENRDYLISCFRILLYETSHRFGATEIGCASWLNEEPRWLSFFPAEWRENMTPRKEGFLPNMTVGCWGFLYDARGCFNRKYGDMVRSSGVLPFYPRTSFCTHEAMTRHLDTL